MGAQSNVHLHNVPSYKILKDRSLTDVELPLQIPYLLYTNLHGVHGFPQFGTCGGPPRDCSWDHSLPYIHI